jgi:hypothetical protein
VTQNLDFIMDAGPIYDGGDFFLTLDNYDMNGFAYVYGGLVENAEQQGLPLDGDATILIKNGTDIRPNVDEAAEEPQNSSDVRAYAFGKAKVELRDTSTILANDEAAILAQSIGATATIITDKGTSVSSLNTTFGILANSRTNDVTVTANGKVTSDQGTAIAAASNGGDVIVTTTNVVSGGDALVLSPNEEEDDPVGGIFAFAETEGEGQVQGAVPGDVTVNASGPVSGYFAIAAGTAAGDIAVTTGAGAIAGKTFGIVTRSREGGDVVITTGTGKVSADTITEDGDDGIAIGAVSGDEYDFLFNKGQGGNVTVTTGGDVEGINGGIAAGSVKGNVSITTAASKTTKGVEGDGIFASAGVYPGNYGETEEYSPGGGGGDVTVLTNGKVEGGERGINAESLNGKVSVTAKDDVKGMEGDGIQARAGEQFFDPNAISNDIRVVAEGSGDVKVVTEAKVDGGSIGVNAWSLQGNVEATVEKNALINGLDGDGVRLNAGYAEVFNDGNRYVEASSGGGNVTANINGKVNGTDTGVNVWTRQGNAKVIAAAGSSSEGKYDNGINARAGFIEYVKESDQIRQQGGGDVTVVANGLAVGSVHGISTWTREGTIDVKTGANSFTSGGDGNGINAEAGANYYDEQNGLLIQGGKGTVSVEAGGTVEGNQNGIYAWSNEGNVAVKTLANASIKGKNQSGISAESGSSYFDEQAGEYISFGKGDATVDIAAGTKVAGNEAGIQVFTRDGTSKVKTAAGSSVKGEGEFNSGIQLQSGNASDEILVDDEPTIFYDNGKAVDADIAGEVSGGQHGIQANVVNGKVTIVTQATSLILGKSSDGIDASAGRFSAEIGGGSVSVDTAGYTTGAQRGINASNRNGNVTVTTQLGSETSGFYDAGINANAGDSESEVASGGDVVVTANGKVTGGLRGISAGTSTGNTKVVTGAKSVIKSTKTEAENTSSGIEAFSNKGDAEVTAGGIVEGAERGIGVFADSDGDAKVTILASAAITGLGENGIQIGSEEGDATAVVDGQITGQQDGIRIFSDAADGDTMVTVGATAKIKGGLESAGIDAYTLNGDAIVTNSGLIEGDWTGVYVSNESEGLRQVSNLSKGVIRNSSLKFDRTAIEVNFDGEGTKMAGVVNNQGRVDGQIRISNLGNITNSGLWNTLGNSNYADSGLIDNTGTGIINSAHDASKAEQTSFSSSMFKNTGLISMADAVAGSGNKNSDVTTVFSNSYTGGGTVALNAYLDSYTNSTADLFKVNGSATGQTLLRVVNTNADGGAFVDEATGKGILLAIVDGQASANAFALEGGIISTGVFDYYLVSGSSAAAANKAAALAAASAAPLPMIETKAASKNASTTYQLFSRPNSGAAASAPQIASGANGVWQETTDVWIDRQEELRDGGTQVTAVSSHGMKEASSPGSVWMHGLVGKVDHKGNSSFNGKVVDSGFDQNIYGIVGGADMGTDLSSGGTLLFGLTGGYTNSDVKFTSGTNKLAFDGFSLGAYATILQDGFFASALVKGEFLNLKHTAGAQSGKTDVTALGLRADAGYRMGSGAMVFEPLVSMSYINTSIDAYSIGLTQVGNSSNDSLNAGVGARATYNTDAISMSLTGRVWNNFSNSAKVDITVPGVGTSPSVGEGTFAGTYGEVAANLSANLTDNLSLYGGGAVKFDSNTTAKTVFGGVNVSF